VIPQGCRGHQMSLCHRRWCCHHSHHTPSNPQCTPTHNPTQNRRLKRAFGGPLILAASPGDMLKLSDETFTVKPPVAERFTHLDLLVIDEASMLHFGHALAVVLRLLRPGGRVVLAGDHRQLAAISKYDFESDLRASVVMHQAHLSCYDYVWRLGQAGEFLVSLLGA